jgi:hypothetical protein
MPAPEPEAVILLLLLFSSSHEFNFPKLGGNSETGSGLVGLCEPVDSARILTMLRCVVPIDSESELRGEYCETLCAPGNRVEGLLGGASITLPSSYENKESAGISILPSLETGCEPRGPGILSIVETDLDKNAGGGRLGARCGIADL